MPSVRLRRLLATVVVTLIALAIVCPTTESVATADPQGPPCCDTTWCISQESLCTTQCNKYKKGSDKWKECNHYCSKTLSRCTSCCRTHREPNCHVYCFE